MLHGSVFSVFSLGSCGLFEIDGYYGRVLKIDSRRYYIPQKRVRIYILLVRHDLAPDGEATVVHVAN